MKKTIALSILLCVLFTFMSCSGGLVPKWSINEFAPDTEYLYFYGVVISGGEHYACVLTEYKDKPSSDELRHLPLSENVSASFQPVGLVGAWRPVTYYSAGELRRAYSDGLITVGAQFSYAFESGYLTELNEKSYYDNMPY